MKYGFITVASAIPQVKVGDTAFNAESISKMIHDANNEGVEIVVFPELSITGYTCQDLFRQRILLENVETSLIHILEVTRQLDIISIVGTPIEINNALYNCAVVFQHGKILGIVPKKFLPNYNEFYEKRWFTSSTNITDKMAVHFAGNHVEISSQGTIFITSSGAKFGIELCEDVWSPTPPSDTLSLMGADLIFNLSASDELVGKNAYLKSLLSQQSARTMSGYIYSSCGYGESTQDVVYGGNALIYENGSLIAEGSRFSTKPQLIINQIDIEKLRAERMANTTFAKAQADIKTAPISIECEEIAEQGFELLRKYPKHPFLSEHTPCDDIINIQALGLMKRISHIGIKKVVIGVSGGSDSTLALLICIKAFDALKLDRKGIIGVTMPGFGTTSRTYNNSLKMMELLGITSIEVPIKESVLQHFKDIGYDSTKRDVTYENCQARERTQILMDIANKEGGLVIGTGDLSELALGWCTYNADHMSMYAVNVSIPKTLVKHLIRHMAKESDSEASQVILDIVDTPVSPELLPPNEDGTIKQVTEDNIGPYELHDFFLYHFLRFGFRPKKLLYLAFNTFKDTYDEATIRKWLSVFIWRFFSQQFKRSCLPDGPKVGSVSLSPRGDWRMPSDAECTLWLREIKEDK